MRSDSTKSGLFLLPGVKDETIDKVGGWASIIATELINCILGEGQEIIPTGQFDFSCSNRGKKDNTKVVCETLAGGKQEPNV